MASGFGTSAGWGMVNPGQDTRDDRQRRQTHRAHKSQHAHQNHHCQYAHPHQRDPCIPERPPRFCVPAGRSQTASSQVFVNHALRCFERTRAMLRLPPRVEPSRCLRARRPCRDHAAHPRRDFLMVRPDAIEHACDYFPCTHARIRRLGTWARFAAVHATPLGRLSFPLPYSALGTAHY